MSINSNSVGINTTNPVSELDVRGDVFVESDLRSLGNIIIGTVEDINNNRLYVDGNVETTATLTANDIIVQNLTVIGSNTLVNTDVKITDQFQVSNIGTGPAVIINQTGMQDILQVFDDGNIAFIVADDAKIGIRTETPEEALHVVGNIKLEAGHMLVDSNIVCEGDIDCSMDINVGGKINCDNFNNIILKYDPPDVIITNTYINTNSIQLTIQKPIFDNDGYGNLIPNIDNLILSYSNNIDGVESV